MTMGRNISTGGGGGSGGKTTGSTSSMIVRVIKSITDLYVNHTINLLVPRPFFCTTRAKVLGTVVQVPLFFLTKTESSETLSSSIACEYAISYLRNTAVLVATTICSRRIGGASGRDLQVRFGSVPVRCRCAARSFRRWHQIGLKKLFQKKLCNNAATYRSSVDLNTFAVS
jgi:hypothetical protein